MGTVLRSAPLPSSLLASTKAKAHTTYESHQPFDKAAAVCLHCSVHHNSVLFMLCILGGLLLGLFGIAIVLHRRVRVPEYQQRVDVVASAAENLREYRDDSGGLAISAPASWALVSLDTMQMTVMDETVRRGLRVTFQQNNSHVTLQQWSNQLTSNDSYEKVVDNHTIIIGGEPARFLEFQSNVKGVTFTSYDALVIHGDRQIQFLCTFPDRGVCLRVMQSAGFTDW